MGVYPDIKKCSLGVGTRHPTKELKSFTIKPGKRSVCVDALMTVAIRAFDWSKDAAAS